MTDKQKLDAIKAEIHRLVDVRGYDREMANDLLAFMNSLPNEPVSEDLEKEMNKMFPILGHTASTKLGFYDVARHFANWQKQKDEENTKSMYKVGINLGKEQMRQQIMKDAVEVPIEEAVPFGSCKWKLCAKLWLDKGVKGNKVKLVIIKDE